MQSKFNLDRITVSQLLHLTGGGIRCRFHSKCSGKDIDYDKLTRREKAAFRERTVYMIFPTDDPKILSVSVY